MARNHAIPRAIGDVADHENEVKTTQNRQLEVYLVELCGLDLLYRGGSLSGRAVWFGLKFVVEGGLAV